MLLPVLSSARNRAVAAKCMGNLRQLMLAWKMYADDSASRLVPNTDNNGGNPDEGGWVKGWMNYSGSNPDNTNIMNLIGPQALFSPYIQNYMLYKCPSDQSRVKTGGETLPRVRSYAMNGVIGYGSTVNEAW